MIFSSYLQLVWILDKCSCLSASNKNELWSLNPVMLILWENTADTGLVQSISRSYDSHCFVLKLFSFITLPSLIYFQCLLYFYYTSIFGLFLLHLTVSRE